MSFSIYPAFFIFATIMVITPGPANLVLMSSGARFGFYKSIPFVIGVTFGKLFLTLGLGLGFLTLVYSNEFLLNGIKILGTAYIFWLSWKILFLKLDKNSSSDHVPSLTNGLLVHPLNPKAWAMIIAAYTQFTSFGSSNLEISWLTEVAIVASTFFAIQAVSHSLWCLGGGLIFNFLVKTNISRQIVVTFLSVLTIGTVIYSNFII
jgi:threonine/homoserine/homoserine lactone efflux protein